MHDGADPIAPKATGSLTTGQEVVGTTEKPDRGPRGIQADTEIGPPLTTEILGMGHATHQIQLTLASGGSRGQKKNYEELTRYSLQTY